jgi:hypothetical protein
MLISFPGDALPFSIENAVMSRTMSVDLKRGRESLTPLSSWCHPFNGTLLDYRESYFCGIFGENNES